MLANWVFWYCSFYPGYMTLCVMSILLQSSLLTWHNIQSFLTFFVYYVLHLNEEEESSDTISHFLSNNQLYIANSNLDDCVTLGYGTNDWEKIVPHCAESAQAPINIDSSNATQNPSLKGHHVVQQLIWKSQRNNYQQRSCSHFENL